MLWARTAGSCWGISCGGRAILSLGVMAFGLWGLKVLEEVAHVVHRRAFLGLEGAHALEHEIPVDLMGVEFGTVDADELRLAADGDAAAAAHARSVDHDRVEGGDRLHAERLRRERAELHHDGRTDGDDLVDGSGCAELLERFGDESLTENHVDFHVLSVLLLHIQVEKLLRKSIVHVLYFQLEIIIKKELKVEFFLMFNR